MKVSRKLLQNYVNLAPFSDEVIASKLTFAGIEVEYFEKLASGTNLVVGEVLTCEKLANSEHLSLTTVNLGPKFGVKQIICGAPNVRKGLKVIVAQVGAVLPDIVIKKAQIKGVESEGMICSLKELGVADALLSKEDINGIHELNADAIVGEEKVLELSGLDDTIFTLKPLANRSDMNAIYNIALELGALFEAPVTIPSFDIKSTFATRMSLKVTSPLVSQFSLTEVKNIKVGPSPAWLVKVLEVHGFRAVNNIVDIGNYVMLLTGRPLHMYDLEEVKDEKFLVTSDSKVSFTALDLKTYDLIPGDQIISDESQVLCLGGISGSNHCRVSEKSTRIAIEVAYFDATSIRLSATRLNLPSESSSRFAKGVNRYNYEQALALALHLLQETCPNILISNTLNFDAGIKETKAVLFDATKINKLLGTSFTEKEMIDALARLSIRVKKDGSVAIPEHRNDIYSTADLAEEIIRLLGFEHIKAELPILKTTIGELSPIQRSWLEIRRLLRSLGLYETLSYTLVSKEQTETFAYLNKEAALNLEHPMTPLRAYIRSNLLPSVLETLAYNVARQASDFAIFEVSNINGLTYKNEHLAIALYGKKARMGQMDSVDYDFYDIKGSIETILKFLGLNESRYEFVSNSLDTKELHPAQSALLKVQGQIVGVLGKLHPKTQKEFNLNDNTLVAELNLSALLNVKTSSGKINLPAKFPFVTRDLALVVDKELAVGTILKEIKKAGGKLVSDVQVFDVYTKLLAEPTKKSVAIRITLSDAQKTLVDADIKEVLETIKEVLSHKLKAEVRK